MVKSKMIQVFGESLKPKQRKSFRYKLNGKGRKVTGILHSNNAELSVSFHNETELEINSLETLLTDSLELPPAKRIITWEQDLKDCSFISGIIKNLSPNNENINLYLILDQ